MVLSYYKVSISVKTFFHWVSAFFLTAPRSGALPFPLVAHLPVSRRALEFCRNEGSLEAQGVAGIEKDCH